MPHTARTPVPFSFECCYKQSDSQKQNLHSRLWARENLHRQVTHSGKWCFIVETVTPSKPSEMDISLEMKIVFTRSSRNLVPFILIMNASGYFWWSNSSCDRDFHSVHVYIEATYWAGQSVLCFFLLNHLAT